MAIIGSLPYTLVNGTTADATQVMADFNWISSQVNANGVPATGPATITGNLSVSGSVNAASGLTTTLQDGVFIDAASGQTARYRSLSTGHDEWNFGSDASGNFTIVDKASAFSAMTIYPNANIDVNGVISIFTSNGVAMAAPSAGTAYYGATVTGARAWEMGCDSSGNFQIIDQTGSLGYVKIDPTTGITWISGPLMGQNTIRVTGNGIQYTTYAPNFIAFLWSAGTVKVYVDNSNVGTIQMVSDERLKQNIAPPEGDPLTEISRLRLISFDLPDRVGTEPARHVRMGFSANQVEEVMPDAVTKAPEHALDPKRDLVRDPLRDDEQVRSIENLPLLARCVGAIQQLTARVAALEAQLAVGR